MSGLDWQAPDFLSNTSGDDYLASLASFLDGSDNKFQQQGQPHDLSVFGVGQGLGSVPPLGMNNASSPELTSDSGASPASSDGTNNNNNTTINQGVQSRRSTGQSSTSSGNPNPTTTVASTLHDKRKGGPQTTQAIKDRRSSGTGARTSMNTIHHSHPDGVDGEITRSASPEEDGKKGGKKTSEKRKAQNRAAQRNFRERKEKHLKELEDKVGVLEQKSNDQEAENSALKQLLQQLKSENDRLKVFESAFSFSYDKDVNNSSTMPTSSTFDSSSSSSASRPPLPATSSSSTNSTNDSPNASFSFDNSSFELPVSHSTELPYTSTSSASSTSFPNYPITSSLPSTSSAGAFPDNLFLNSLTVPPTSNSFSGESPISPVTNASLSSGSTRASSYGVTTPPPPSLPTSTPLGGDMFSSYRDPLADLSLPSAPLATFSDFDALFGTSGDFITNNNNNNTLTSSTSSPEDSLSTMSQFIKSPSPLNSSSELPTPPPIGTTGFRTSQDGKKKIMVTGQEGCPYGLNVGEKYEFDLDNLCSEMKLKATCQEAARQALASAMAEDAKISMSAYPSQQQ